MTINFEQAALSASVATVVGSTKRRVNLLLAQKEVNVPFCTRATVLPSATHR
jgi:hypothetical protein